MSKKWWVILTSIFFLVAVIEFAVILSMLNQAPSVKIIKVAADNTSNGTSDNMSTSKVIDVGVPNRIQDNIETTVVDDSTAAATVRTGKYAKWYILKIGMSQDQVLSILGKPKLIKKGISVIWRYSYNKEHFGDVIFYKGKVITWLPPTITLEEAE